MSTSSMDEKSTETSEDPTTVIATEESKPETATSSHTSNLNQSIKKLSISSLESLNSDIAASATTSSSAATAAAAAAAPVAATTGVTVSNPLQQSQQCTTTWSAVHDEYDYIKAGAKPKTTKRHQHQTAVSTSTSCSSLSSLISQTSSSTTSKHQHSKHGSSSRPSLVGSGGGGGCATSTVGKSQVSSSQIAPTTNDDSIIVIDDESSSTSATAAATTAAAAVVQEQSQLLQLQQQQTKCPLCMKSIGDYDLEAHFQLEHREFECPFCGLLFDAEVPMQQHLNLVHGESQMSGSTRELDVFDDECESGDQRYTCPMCDLKFKDEIWLEIHVDTHFNPQTDAVVNINPSTSYKNDLVMYGRNAEAASLSQNANRTVATTSWPDQNQQKQQQHLDGSDDDDLPLGAVAIAHQSSLSRANSASSLAANVDENFEIDQMAILAESMPMMPPPPPPPPPPIQPQQTTNMIVDLVQDEPTVVAATELEEANVLRDQFHNGKLAKVVENRKFDSTSSDYQIALLLEKEERERFDKLKSEALLVNDLYNQPSTSTSKSSQITSDFIRAQMLERNQNEAAKYKLAKENIGEDLAAANYAHDYQLDSDYAAELEHEWLRQRYGMNNENASSKALMNLERALKSQRIDYLTYQSEKEEIENRLSKIYDDETTCSKDLIETLRAIPLGKTITRRLVCTKCIHYASGVIDTGYGCGYRNTQMLLSSIREDPVLAPVIFNNNNFNIPSVSKIQQLIENAWRNGFDLMGQAQLGGVLYKTAKWIGASDVAAMFLSLRIRVELVDIKLKQGSQKSISDVLFDFVRTYFEQEQNYGRHIHPIYLQHEGHSRTIIGFEESPKARNLLIFDPSTRKSTIDQNRGGEGGTGNRNQIKLLNLFRRNLSTFDKKREYQLLVIRGAITSNDEYMKSKVLQSTKLS